MHLRILIASTSEKRIVDIGWKTIHQNIKQVTRAMRSTNEKNVHKNNFGKKQSAQSHLQS